MKKKSILISNPLIAKDWDLQKNVDLNIEMVSSTDKGPVWWICENEHSYSVSPYTRIRTNGCKFCNKESKGKTGFYPAAGQTGVLGVGDLAQYQIGKNAEPLHFLEAP